jgi:hypothetical protein
MDVGCVNTCCTPLTWSCLCQEKKEPYEWDYDLGIPDLLLRLESGSWNLNNKRKRRYGN